MSRTSVTVDHSPAELPLPALLEALAALGVSFECKGEGLALRGSRTLTGELRDAIADHKPALLIVCECRAKTSRLHEYLIRLRVADPPKGCRAQAFAYQERQIDKLAARSVDVGGTKDGWPDPADVFAAGDQIKALREGLAELTRADAPYPLPLPDGCHLLPQANFDPFEFGRLYNGKVSRQNPS
jgi:hypothetical protein